jgi:hypothetical protein
MRSFQHELTLRQLADTALALPGFSGTPLAQDLQDGIETYQREALPRRLSA